ncbi:MAG: hypothetical protein EOR04_13540 [Mesorhizobium sp.]|uniref:hypothetical protein n=1 Tax=Mesorhizobium sp. TaxID=1871066 RepID=UPI000FE483F8|nr:hypothetical protein [Mesorhizobium sp.]RWP41760.1 MAG: hypothetical protein EOR04_13540 [Mesorhizobium sp.]
MAEDVFIAISSEALHAKSKVYMGRAMVRKAAGDLDEYQLWASLALELLGKAALSRQHPSLAVDPLHAPSLFVAAGVNITTDVKTITAKTLFERLTHLVPRFDKLVQKFCMDIAERRNSELHSADLPFKTMRLDAWEAHYWHACDTILRHMKSSLEDWIGAADAAAPRQLLDEAAAALEAAVKLRVEAARAAFLEQKKAERERLLAESELREPEQQVAFFPNRYDEIWIQPCPACACRAFMTGDQTGEDITQEPDEYGIWEVVDREFVGEEFKCPTCELALAGSDELDAAGINYIHEDRQEREMEYEPDYGND